MRLDVEDVGRSWGQLSAWDRWTGKGRKREEEATDVFTCETVFRRRGGLGVDCVGARGEVDTYYRFLPATSPSTRSKRKLSPPNLPAAFLAIPPLRVSPSNESLPVSRPPPPPPLSTPRPSLEPARPPGLPPSRRNPTFLSLNQPTTSDGYPVPTCKLPPNPFAFAFARSSPRSPDTTTQERDLPTTFLPPSLACLLP